MSFSEKMAKHIKDIQSKGYKDIVGMKTEITEEDYYYFLEVLPPIYLKGNKGFLLMEALTHNEKGAVRDRFWEENGKYFTEVVNECDYVSRQFLTENGFM